MAIIDQALERFFPFVSAAWSRDRLIWPFRASRTAIPGSTEPVSRKDSGLELTTVFSESWYLAAYADVAVNQRKGLEHFRRFGQSEGRNPVPIFDHRWYLDRYPDVAANGMPPFRHFLKHGLREGRDPHPLFDADFYIRTYPDVAASGLSAFWHFLNHGLAEGRDPHPLFDTAFYIQRYHPDPSVPPFTAFLLRGLADGHIPTRLFDTDWYLQCNPDLVAAGVMPFEHFVKHGLAEGRDPHPLFDADFYIRTYPDVASSGLSAFRHFLHHGLAEGRDPHPLFCSSWYCEKYRDRLRGVPAFLHYLANGDLRPNEMFDPAFVAHQIHQLDGEDKQVQQLAGLERLVSLRSNKATGHQAATIVFTSIASNYLPYAFVLADSLKRHNGNIHFVIILCDEPSDILDQLPSSIDEVVLARDLIGDGFQGWAFQHGIVELCTAVKGFALEHFLDRPSCTKVIYFDPDIFVMHDLGIIDTELEAHAIVVTPHLLTPERETDAIRQNEVDALRHGAFNLGFLAVRNDAAGRRFAAWWRERLRRFCQDHRAGGLFVDQKWMDLAPSFFPELGILRHPGCNVAPWNLNQRRIAGDTFEGFTANGETLIFFHFSGHANGTGESMLARFGHDMPAAWLLASLYRHQLTMMSADARTSATWAYGFYENGTEVTPEERHLYRSRKDLQVRFPEPFKTDPGVSFLHWLRRTGNRQANVAHTVLATRHPHRTLLEQFLIVGKTDAIRMNPLLDLDFYLDTHLDVARSGCDPFRHFLTAGIHEGRQSSADFNLSFYCRQAGRTDLEACFREVLAKGVDEGLRPVPTYIARLDRPVLDRMAAAMDNGLSRLLMISHDWGGGTSKHVRELSALLRGKVNIVSLTFARGNRVVLTVAAKGIDALTFQLGDLGGELVEALRVLRIDRVHVHHAVGMDADLPKLLRRLGRPYDVTLHDSYFLAPNPLFRHTHASRTRPGLDRAMTEAMATPIGRPLPPRTDLATWQEQFFPTLKGAERLIAPTHFIADTYLSFYPELRPIVVPHYEIACPELPLKTSSLAVDALLTVAMVGETGGHKGIDLVALCALAARRRELPLRFIVLGPGSDELLDAGVASSGTYDDRDLPALLAIHDVRVMWLPYTAPESYSYALSVALRSGLQVLSTDVGCFPERTSNVPQATLLPVDAAPETWLNTLLELRSRLIAGTAKAKPVQPQRSTFYPDGYLRVFERTGPQHLRVGLEQSI